MATCAHCKIQETEIHESGIPICLKCTVERDGKARRKPPGTGQSIRSILVDDIAKATARANTASQAFLEVMGQIPNGFPLPNGPQRIHSASSNLSTARKDLMTAHTRLDDFLKTGIVPEDLKRRG